MFSDLISFPIFLVSLTVGLFFVYMFNPSPTVIHVYPTPDNIDKLQFKDYADNCYQFVSKQVKCPSNKSLITKIPVQTNKNPNLNE